MDFSHLSQQDQLKDMFSRTFRVKHIASPLTGAESGDAKSIDCNALLQDAVLRLKNEEEIIVLQDGKACGVISEDDLNKPALRMWLFGVLTILSEGRADKAKSLFEERKRIGKPSALIE